MSCSAAGRTGQPSCQQPARPAAPVPSSALACICPISPSRHSSTLNVPLPTPSLSFPIPCPPRLCCH
eukprot:768513-Hanusia_phi.AAC.2